MKMTLYLGLPRSLVVVIVQMVSKSKAMKIEIREIYKCEYCNKLYQRKHAAIKHEKRCNKNPTNDRPCFDCSHLTSKDAEVYIGIDDYCTHDPIYEVRTLLFCKNKSMFLYPPKSDHKGSYFTEFYHEENSNNPMPKECKCQSKCFLMGDQ